MDDVCQILLLELIVVLTNLDADLLSLRVGKLHYLFPSIHLLVIPNSSVFRRGTTFSQNSGALSQCQPWSSRDDSSDWENVSDRIYEADCVLLTMCHVPRSNQTIFGGVLS